MSTLTKDTTSVIYAIQASDGGPIKIGSTRNLERRLRNLQLANHSTLVVLHKMPGGVVTERRLRQRLRHLHVRGEWFRDAPELHRAFTDSPEDVPDAVVSVPVDANLGLAERIREARRAASLTQRELAQRLGFSERSIQGWEAGTTFPRPSQRRAVLAFIAEHENGKA